MRRATIALLTSLLTASAARRASAADPPQISWEGPIRCIRDPAGRVVHVQCDEAKGACLVAPTVGSDGNELRRIMPCDNVEGESAMRALERRGVRFIPAIAEAPPGFARAESGRAFQVQFDLLDRIYVGAAWTPTFRRPDPRSALPQGFPLGRGKVEIGFEASALSPRGRSRHDFKVAEGAVSFSDLQVSGLLFAYDYQQAHRRPALWLSTFVGKPRVFPIPLPLGWGFRVVRVEDRPPGSRGALDFELAETHASWSPWQSPDLYSHLRFEAGADVGKRLPDRRAGFGAGDWYVGPTGAVRARLSLGRGGLHYLFADLDVARPLVARGDRAGKPILRLDGALAYEGVLIAINDQPISVRLAAKGGAREDPLTGARTVELSADAGLRFSFWAPPRVFQPLPDLEDP